MARLRPHKPRQHKFQNIYISNRQDSKRKVNEQRLNENTGVAGHRTRDPPDPIPNSEVKPRSVSSVSAVFGRAKPGKLAAPLRLTVERWMDGGKILKLYY